MRLPRPQCKPAAVRAHSTLCPDLKPVAQTFLAPPMVGSQEICISSPVSFCELVLRWPGEREEGPDRSEPPHLSRDKKMGCAELTGALALCGAEPVSG